MDEGSFGLDEVGEVWRDHGDDVLDVHLVDQSGEEETVVLVLLHSGQ